MTGSEPGRTADRAWVEVDLDALVRNARRVVESVRPARFLPMVKANGYGLGAVACARALQAVEPYAFGVATVAEGVELRAAGIQDRIVVFAPLAERAAGRLLSHGLDAGALSLASFVGLERSARENGGCLALHLEIDTGMGRAGLPASGAADWAPEIASALARGGATLASVYTHFHSADRDGDATAGQLDRFETALETLESVGVSIPLRHAANSDAMIRAGQYHLDLVRPGIYLYGARRGTGMEGGLPDPEPVARVRARVLEVRDLDPASTISYGATYATGGAERIATLGIGYADGIPWGAANRASALIGGTRVPFRGAVCMDVIVVDVSGASGVEPGTVATLLGRDGDEEIELAELAGHGRTIEWDLLTGLGPRLERRYVVSGRG
ncbi:MAG: alanine racemase [Gemmatimonadetes bacterium]|nr:alanine racemase [Gemmatimonadota bacterium]